MNWALVHPEVSMASASQGLSDQDHVLQAAARPRRLENLSTKNRSRAMWSD